MTPVTNHLPLNHGPLRPVLHEIQDETTSGVANVRTAVTAAPAEIVRLHRSMCCYAVMSIVVLIAAIVFFISGCVSSAHAQGSFNLPPPLTTDSDYNPGGKYNPLPVPVPDAEHVTNAAPAPEPTALALAGWGLGIFAGIALGRTVINRLTR